MLAQVVCDVFGEFFQTSILDHSKHSGYDFVITLRNTITAMTAGEFLHKSQAALELDNMRTVSL